MSPTSSAFSLIRFARPRLAIAAVLAACSLALGHLPAAAQCQRMTPGSVVQDPENLYSIAGSLRVHFTYQRGMDVYGNPTFCFINDDGQQSPTLHVKPGDTLILTLTNELPPPA